MRSIELGIYVQEKLIKLEDLPDIMRLGLEEKFRKKLFEKAENRIGGTKKLAKLLRVDRSTVWNLKRGASFIKVKALKKLSIIASVPLEVVEKNITEIKTRNKKRRITIKFPILTSKELANLIGHCMGDGNLSKKQFSFFNQCRELIDEVINDVQKSFNTSIVPKEFKKSGGWEIEFPTNIARLIALCGGPVGQKVNIAFNIPTWIKKGDESIKSSFIRGLFDDECSIKESEKCIIFGMNKNEKILRNHKDFLEELRKLLLDLNISSNNLRKPQKNKSGSIEIKFSISGSSNLKNFFTQIGLTNPFKRLKLNKLCK